MRFEKIGTTKRQICEYDGREHEVKLTDYLVRLSGDTYHNRQLIWKQNRLNSSREQFYYDDMDKAWYANIESEDEINRLYKVFEGTGVKFSIKPIFRIMDL